MPVRRDARSSAVALLVTGLLAGGSAAAASPVAPVAPGAPVATVAPGAPVAPVAPVAPAQPAAAAGGLLRLAEVPVTGDQVPGTDAGRLAASVAGTCGPHAARYRLRVVDVAASDPREQGAVDGWRGRDLQGPATAGLPGPFEVTAPLSWRDAAAGWGLPLVPGTYVLALQCTSSTGARVSREFRGDTVVFTSPTTWVVDPAYPADPAGPAGPADVGTEDQVEPPASDAALGPEGIPAASAAGPVTLAVVADSPVAGSTVTLRGTVSSVGAVGAVTTTDPASSGSPRGMCHFLEAETLLGQAPLGEDGTCALSRSFAAGEHALSVRHVPGPGAGSTSDRTTSDRSTSDRSTSDRSPTVVLLVHPATGAGDGRGLGQPGGPVPPGCEVREEVGAQPKVVPPPCAASPGQLLISTPYTPENPLALGSAVLDAAGSSYSSSAPFDRVTVVDTRAGSVGWTASLDRNDFSGPGGTIPALHSGLEGVAPAGPEAARDPELRLNDVPAEALTDGPEPFARALPGHGPDPVAIQGTFVLRGVATSTPPGTYTTTVVFTVG